MVGIIPVGIIGQLSKEAVLSKKIKIDEHIVYMLTLIAMLIFLAIEQNSDLLIGTIVGSSWFQLLVVNGITKLNMPEEKKEGRCVESIWRWYKEKKQKPFEEKQKNKYRNNGQFLICSAILLLFLAADYLIRVNSMWNQLSRIDGCILIILFLGYLYFMQEEPQKISSWSNRNREKKQSNETEKEVKAGRKKTERIIWGVQGGILVIVIFVGSYLLVKSMSKIGSLYQLSPYRIGITGMAWCTALPEILLGMFFDRKKKSENSTMKDKVVIELEEEKRIEEVIRNVIITITLVLGMFAVFQPILVNTFMIYDFILFGIITVFLQFIKRMNSHIVGSFMTTIYIALIIFVIMR